MSKVVVLLTASALAAVFPAAAFISIDTVFVGHTGNSSDVPSDEFLTTGYGGVSYGYAMGKYEVTVNQYAAFLNAVAATDSYGLYNSQMTSEFLGGGILQNGTDGSYTYSIFGSGNRPVAYVNWFDAARFVNWLHNGQPVGAQAAGTTETGVYSLNGALSGTQFTRNAGWTVALPSPDEWHKAAYFQPADQGGDADGYWQYATRSNEIPNSRNGSATDPNSANFYRDDGMVNGFNGGFAANDSTDVPDGVLLDVGSFSLASSFYGTFDQAGNVAEWTELTVSGWQRGIMGGSWANEENRLRAPGRFSDGPDLESAGLGFRVVMIPEPTAFSLMVLGLGFYAVKRRSFSLR